VESEGGERGGREGDTCTYTPNHACSLTHRHARTHAHTHKIPLSCTHLVEDAPRGEVGLVFPQVVEVVRCLGVQPDRKVVPEHSRGAG
jgi:hypothetical protein